LTPGKNKSNVSKSVTELIDLIPSAVIIADDQGYIVAANKANKQLVGYSSEEIVGKKIAASDFFGKDAMSILQKKLKMRLKGRQIPPYEVKIKTKNDGVKFLELKANIIEYKGRVYDLVILTDVTERSNNQKQLQQALIKSEEKFYGITNSIRDAVILVNEDGEVTYWNPAAEKVFGYTSKEAIGKYIHELVVPETMCKEALDRVDESVRVFSKTGCGYFTVGNVEVVGRRKDGREFPADLAVSPVKIGEKWHAVGVVKDISQRKKNEQKLTEAEQRYHSLFTLAPLGIAIVDPETAKFVEFNDVAAQQLGYTREEFAKLTLHDVNAEEDEDFAESKMTEMLRNGGGEFETRHRTKNGEIKNMLVNVLTIQLAGKTFNHAVFHDVTEIRKVQNALIESESRYRQLVELAQEGIWAIDNDLNTVFVNPRMAQMLGYSQSEMNGTNLTDYLDEGKVEKITNILQKFNQPGVKGQYEYAFPRKDGSHISTGLAVSTITDDQGHVIGKLALVADMTDRKNWENELRASEERFRAISTSAMDAILLIDEVGTIIYWNPAAERAFGYSEKEALGRKFSGLLVLRRSKQGPDVIAKEMSSKSYFWRNLDFSAVRKNGTRFPIEVTLTSLKLKDKNCVLAIARDVSERRSMEDALIQERDMLENMAASMDAGLTLISRDYRILWANQLLKQSSSDNLENKLCYTIYDKSNRICPDCGVRKVFENGVSVDRHDYKRKTDGPDEWVELIVTPVKDKNGEIVAALELTVNITERKRLQQKLAEYSQRLEALVQQRTGQLKKTQAELVKSERFAAIGELAGMVGHDLRNPLTGIKNSAYYLKKKGAGISSSQAKEMLEIIERCVDYSNKIVNDLLDYSRDINLELRERNPRQLMLESLSMVQVPENVKIVNNLLDKQAFKVDPDKIKRVFVNLVKNAFDAMPNGGTLTIDGKVNGHFEFSFADTGAGISEEVLPKLFSPLFTTKAKGMGFGLAICKRIVEAHGGKITVKTVKNQGTTFVVSLPIEPKLEVGGERIWINTQESSLSMTTKA
jgi:PAS domain S-box-containing protein